MLYPTLQDSANAAGQCGMAQTPCFSRFNYDAAELNAWYFGQLCIMHMA